MARAPRIEYPGAIYHVMNRGDRMERIFQDEQDRGILLQTLGEAAASAGWHVHSFVFMSNHYHLLIETPRATLVRGMQYLNSTYTRRNNVRHKSHGHVFQGRYKALLVDGEAKGYLLAASDYIHLNPVRAGAMAEAKQLLGDRWSSLGWLCGVRKGMPGWLKWGRVYGELGIGGWNRRRRKEFREYIERRVSELRGDEAEWKRLRRGWCYGSEDFMGKMKEKLEDLVEKPVKSDTWNDEASDELEEIRAARDLERGCKVLGGASLGGLERWDRYLLAEWVRTRNRVRIDWLGARIGNFNRGSMSGSLFQLRKKLKEQRKLQAKWRLLSEN